MLNEEELRMVFEVFSKLTFKAGQSQVVAKVETMLQKIKEKLEPEGEKDVKPSKG